MLSCISKYLLFISLAWFVFSCKKPFAPKAITANNNYLVVDGVINTGKNGVTTIKLTRSRNIGDSTYAPLPENGATITIENGMGNMYPLQQQPDASYASNPLNLDTSQTYRLNIVTSNGEQYQSDFVKVKQSPAIDSISWEQNNGVNIYAYTHDPTNNTRYYRWDFTETFQHNAFYEISWGVKNDTIFSITYVTYATYTYKCWTDNNNTSVILGNTIALSQDVVSKQPVTFIPNNDNKIGIRYSILVRQYALTPEAYQYWSIIQKNTQNIGTLFDLQPSQLHGNIASLSNKDEPVIGWVSAGSIQQQRIFIDHLELTNWHPAPSQLYCPVITIAQNPVFNYYNYPDTTFVPYYFVSGGGLNITKSYCLDCRVQGGTNIKPSFWQ